MLNDSIRQFALQMIARDPRFAGNPRAADLINVIQSGDTQRGMQIAQNLCSSYGITPQQAIEDAKRYFNIS